LAWYEAAGVDGERLAAQRRRAAGEREGDGASLRAEVAPGVELVLLRDVAHELAALAPAPRGDCAIALAPASAPSALRFDGDGAASGAIASALGPLAIAVVHEGLPRIQAEARRQRWLTGVGVALLLLVMATGTLLLRATLLRERRLRQLRLQFIANVSHELRTPLTGLRLHAELLARDDVDAAARRRYGEVADGEGARLSALVEDLLDFAALEQGRRRLEPEPVDLAAAAAALVGGWQTRAEQDGVQLGCEALGEAAALVDPTALARILTNLLQNAFRHGRPPRAGGQSRIAVRVGPGPLLVVADNGPGVRGVPRDGLFERFVKQDGSQGVGLGLALSRELAEACGGALQHRDTGDETRFELRLPAAPALPPVDEVTP
jgi:signal transduction histidine kinase